MSSPSDFFSPESNALPASPPVALASYLSGKRARPKRVGGAFSLLGGVGFIGALLLPWLDYLDISEETCFRSGCYPYPDISNVSGLELLSNNAFFFFLVLPLFLLTVSAAVGIGLLRLLAPGRSFSWSWIAPCLLVMSLFAVGLLLIVPPPPGTYIEYYRIVGQQYEPGTLIALAALLTALLGGIMQLERRHRPSVPAAGQTGDEGQL
jgi:hypothetical protein